MSDSVKNSQPRRRVYLDHAATTWPKLPAAVKAAENFIHDLGATAGRGVYSSALRADRLLADARDWMAKAIGAAGGSDVAMCYNGTHALNAALRGILHSGDRVLTTAVEHNSVLRPLKQLERELGISVTTIDCDARGCVDIEQAECSMQPSTRLIALGHASNVTGFVQDLSAWSRLAKRCGARLLVDASQTLGYIPIDVSRDSIDILSAATHKGLRALMGTGLLYVGRHLQGNFAPMMWGGTGHASEQIDWPPTWPQSVEVGNLNMPGIASLAAAARAYVDDSAAWCETWRPAFAKLIQGLEEIPDLQIVGYRADEWSLENRVPVVSIRVENFSVHDLASMLDASFGIEARAGYHCAALVHDHIGTSVEGGTLRLSTGHTTTLEDIRYTLSALREILGN